MKPFVKRTSGSCRFSPYYKLEWFDDSICAWRPLQKAFPAIDQANDAKTKDRKWRVFVVTETGRTIV